MKGLSYYFCLMIEGSGAIELSYSYVEVRGSVRHRSIVAMQKISEDIENT
jgi:hypothetical protein